MFWSEAEQPNPLNPFNHLRNAYTIFVDYLTVFLTFIQYNFWHLLFGGLILHYIYTRFLKGVIFWMYHKYDRYYERKREEAYAAKYHKNPDLFSSRVSAQQAQVQKLQEKYQNQAKVYEEKLRRNEALKLEGALKNLDKEKGPEHILQDVKVQNEFRALFCDSENAEETKGDKEPNIDNSETIVTMTREDCIKKLQEKYNQQAKEHQKKVMKKEEVKKQESQSKSKSLRPEYNPLMGSGGSNYRPAKKSKCPGGGCG